MVDLPDDIGERDDAADPLGDLVRAPPAETPSETLARLQNYLAVQAELDNRFDDDPLGAIQHALTELMMLHAGLAPAGSPGPHRPWTALLEAVLQMQRGEPPSLLRYGPPRHATSHPSPPHVVYGRALAAAVVSHLMAVGVRKTTATQLAAKEMERAGVKFGRQRNNPPARVSYWRQHADDPHGREPIHLAYREAHAMLDRLLAGVAGHERQAVLLRALHEGVRRVGVTDM